MSASAPHPQRADSPAMGRAQCPLQQFVAKVGRTLDALGAEPDHAALVAELAEPLQTLLQRDDWLPDASAVPHPVHYQQYLLHRDAAERFSVVSFVWGPGQATPVHDHTVWGLVGVLRGAELSQAYVRDPATGGLHPAQALLLTPGQVQAVSPVLGDIHRVSNAAPGAVSVSIHVYGADIGRVQRHVYDPATGATNMFVSGYANHSAAEHPRTAG